MNWLGCPGKELQEGFSWAKGISFSGKKAMILVLHALTYGMKRVQHQNLREEKKEDFRS
jgi:hypothetical protein